ncbi:hypothetical protein AK812_SmicGene45888, partial [Symbiodinium microadriaticum]
MGGSKCGSGRSTIRDYSPAERAQFVLRQAVQCVALCGAADISMYCYWEARFREMIALLRAFHTWKVLLNVSDSLAANYVALFTGPAYRMEFEAIRQQMQEYKEKASEHDQRHSCEFGD